MNKACRCLMANQKVLIFGTAFVTFILGLGLLVVGIKLRISGTMAMFSDILKSESDGAFTGQTTEIILIVFSVVIIVSSFLGCFGALQEQRGALFCYSSCTCLCGLIFLLSGVALYVHLEIMSAQIVRETNRVCHSGNYTQEQLGCDDGTTSNQYNLGANLPSLNTPSLNTPSGGLLGRRLEPGTTEVHFIRSICNQMESCDNPCLLIERLCEPPEDFNEATACMCAGKPIVATALGDALAPTMAPPTSGDPVDGSYCSKWSGSDEEWCYVYPQSSCNPDPPGGLGMNQRVGPFTSNAPCYQIPDSRSSLVVEALGWLWPFIIITIFMGCWLLISTSCGCCLGCELHTGENVAAHARQVVNDEETFNSGFYSADDEDDEASHSFKSSDYQVNSFNHAGVASMYAHHYH